MEEPGKGSGSNLVREVAGLVHVFRDLEELGHNLDDDGVEHNVQGLAPAHSKGTGHETCSFFYDPRTVAFLLLQLHRSHYVNSSICSTVPYRTR